MLPEVKNKNRKLSLVCVVGVSMSPSVCVSVIVCLSVSLYVCLSMSLFVSVCVCVVKSGITRLLSEFNIRNQVNMTKK